MSKKFLFSPKDIFLHASMDFIHHRIDTARFNELFKKYYQDQAVFGGVIMSSDSHFPGIVTSKVEKL